MKTKYIAIRTDGSTTEGECELDEEPKYDAINAVVRPLIATLVTKRDDIEHVTVLHEGERRDLFVDDAGERKNLPRNEEATTIYRHNWITQHPKVDPETMPYIYGDAVFFPHRRIWW